MQLNALVAELLIQLDDDGILQQGSKDVDLETIDPNHTVVVEIAFHVDVMKDSSRRPHADELNVRIFVPRPPSPPAPEQFPTGFRPKGFG